MSHGCELGPACTHNCIHQLQNSSIPIRNCRSQSVFLLAHKQSPKIPHGDVKRLVIVLEASVDVGG
jgi:hypothetical protein